MAISRKKKEQLVADYVDRFSRSNAIFLTDYRGLTVSQLESLRARIREAGGSYSIVKNTLAIRALEAANLPVPEDMLNGPLAIGFAYEEAPAIAKVLSDFARETDILQIKGGLMEGKVLSPAQVSSLASMPPREVILAQLLGLIQQPGNSVAGIVNAVGNKLAATIKAYAEKLENAGAAA
ncbi:MAG: 50S ribosomal protein L10 [Anaerolineae bacterium]